MMSGGGGGGGGDQTKVANHFANFFATMAGGIGGDYVNDCLESNLRNHNSLLNISTNLNKKNQHDVTRFTEMRHFFKSIFLG